MIFDDAWSQGLTEKQQNCVIDFFQAGCRIYSGIGGYKNKNAAVAFLNSKKGRKAVCLFGEFLIGKEKDTVKFQLIKIYAARAFFNPADIIDKNGMLKIKKEDEDLRKLGDLAYCIDGIKLTTTGFEVKLCDRHKSMEALERIFDILNPDNDEDRDGYKSVFEMTDEERDLEIKYLLDKGGMSGDGNKGTLSNKT